MHFLIGITLLSSSNYFLQYQCDIWHGKKEGRDATGHCFRLSFIPIANSSNFVWMGSDFKLGYGSKLWTREPTCSHPSHNWAVVLRERALLLLNRWTNPGGCVGPHSTCASPGLGNWHLCGIENKRDHPFFAPAVWRRRRKPSFTAAKGVRAECRSL